MIMADRFANYNIIYGTCFRPNIILTATKLKPHLRQLFFSLQSKADVWLETQGFDIALYQRLVSSPFFQNKALKNTQLLKKAIISSTELGTHKTS